MIGEFLPATRSVREDGGAYLVRPRLGLGCRDNSRSSGQRQQRWTNGACAFHRAACRERKMTSGRHASLATCCYSLHFAATVEWRGIYEVPRDIYTCTVGSVNPRLASSRSVGRSIDW